MEPNTREEKISPLDFAPVQMDTSILKAWEENPREISESEFNGLKYSMEEFGDLSLIVFNTRTQRLVCGHQRMAGQTERFGVVNLIDTHITDGHGDRWYYFETPDGKFHVRFVDWPEDKELAANVAANAGTIQGKFTSELNGLLKEIKLKKKDAFEAMGFSGLMQSQKAKHDAEKVPGEIQFAQEVDFESNYIVLTFTSDIDWLYIQSLFGIERVYSKLPNGKPWQSGQGRVLGGMEALSRIKAAVVSELDGGSSVLPQVGVGNPLVNAGNISTSKAKN